MSRVIVAGSRTITDRAVVYAAIEAAQAEGWQVDLLISGGARGVDYLALQWACEYGVPHMVITPEWGKYGPAAGPIRNKAMAELAAQGGDGGLILVWDGQSAGSRSMKAEAELVGLRVFERVVAL